MTAPQHLFLFDCDGGRSSLFNKFRIDDVPNSCELYLFWNDHDAAITGRLRMLEKHKNIHLKPNYIKNKKNAADAKLIYFLGKLAAEFNTITIIVGEDRVYEEVVRVVQEDHPETNVTLKTIKYPKSFPFKNIFEHMRNFEEIKTITVDLNVKIRCPECPRRKHTFYLRGLHDHLSTAKVHLDKIEVTSPRPQIRSQAIRSCPKGVVKIIHPSFGKSLSFDKRQKCPLCPGLSQKYKWDAFYNHVTENHFECQYVRIQCCDVNVKYNNVAEFLKHLLGEPFQLTYKMKT